VLKIIESPQDVWHDLPKVMEAGYLHIDEAGLCRRSMSSRDGAALWLSGGR
jgi:hypothetical protein